MVCGKLFRRPVCIRNGSSSFTRYWLNCILKAGRNVEIRYVSAAISVTVLFMKPPRASSIASRARPRGVGCLTRVGMVGDRAVVRSRFIELIQVVDIETPEPLRVVELAHDDAGGLERAA